MKTPLTPKLARALDCLLEVLCTLPYIHEVSEGQVRQIGLNLMRGEFQVNLFLKIGRRQPYQWVHDFRTADEVYVQMQKHLMVTLRKSRITEQWHFRWDVQDLHAADPLERVSREAIRDGTATSRVHP